MTQKKNGFSLRDILTFVTLILVAIVVWENLDSISEAIKHLGDTNLPVLLLLIPEQLFMYYCCGQMFFSFMSAKKNARKVSSWNLMRVSLELNFVNHAVPAGGFGGLAYVSWRLKKFGATPGQSSFMYALRYVITICANQLQTILAIITLLLFGSIPDSGMWIIWVTAIISVGCFIGIGALIVVASKADRIHSFSRFIERFCDKAVDIITFGHKKNKLKYETIDKYLMDIHSDLLMARRNKRILIKPIIWGIIYSFLEVAIYWIVAISRGNPWVLPQILIGEAIGSVLGTIFPIGPYEIGMVGVMNALGVSDALSIVCIARVLVLATTIVSGYGFYQNAISKIGKDDKNNLMQVE